VLLEKVAKGREKAQAEGFQTVLADVRDGISQVRLRSLPGGDRLFTYWRSSIGFLVESGLLVASF
jgi:hypothetical protein